MVLNQIAIACGCVLCLRLHSRGSAVLKWSASVFIVSAISAFVIIWIQINGGNHLFSISKVISAGNMLTELAIPVLLLLLTRTGRFNELMRTS